jgi:hypothetical protein
MNIRHFASAAAAGFALLSGACSSSTTVSGKAIRGDLSFIGVVDAADPRLAQEGLADVELNARGVEARSDRILTDGRSGSNGDFILRIDDPDAVSYPAMVHAHLDGFADARQGLSIPPKDRRLLVILKPLGPVAAPR